MNCGYTCSKVRIGVRARFSEQILTLLDMNGFSDFDKVGGLS